MTSIALLCALLLSVAIPPLHLWAAPIALLLFYLYPALFWLAIGLAGLGVIFYLYKEYR